MGPLANAGPDQFALPGMRIRLDGRGTVPPEDGRPTRARWLQEEGPRVLLSDPASLVTEFVAPPILPGSEDRLVFRLVVEDGAARSSDRVIVHLVESGADLDFAPAAIGGGEIEARPGDEVEIPRPTFVAAACLDEDDPLACMKEPLPHCWTQVVGREVALLDPCGEGRTRFTAPDAEGLLVFRLDAHAHADLRDPRACGPEAEIGDPPLCAAPDYLRVVVRSTPRRGDQPPTTSLTVRNQTFDRVGVVEVGGTSFEIPPQVDVVGTGVDRGDLWRFVPRFRPALGTPGFSLESNRFRVDRPAWPGPMGVVFEPWFYRHHTQGGQTRLEWMRAAPSLAVLHWTPPTNLPLLTADAGPRPCGASSPEPTCEPLEPGQEAVLSGLVEGGAGSFPEVCWEQTFGPKVDLQPSLPSGCGVNQLARTFTAPTPSDDRPLELAFRFYVKDAGPYESRPATLWLQVRPEEVLPPRIEVLAPDFLAAGASGELDASGSVDPHGPALHFRWKQIAGPPTSLRPCSDLEEAAACRIVTAPMEGSGRAVFEVEVASDTTGLVTRRQVEIPILEGN